VPQQYPFSAVVRGDDGDGDDMALALVLATISPEIGGVLVRGEKGTAKSTIVRGLAAVLPPIKVIAGDRFSTDPADPEPLSPDGRFGPDPQVETRPVRLVELPVGATEDRVLGSLHLESALAEGRTEYEPGLLARAHRGILYVDEVNLLHDHLVDLLLDAAAMGRATVERDGVSVEHAARFVLIGTMNPEEGELRPQLLDRFGLTVEVRAPRNPEARVEVVRRRLAFDADPAAFAATYAGDEATLRERIEAAQERVRAVEVSDAALMKIAEVCAAFDVDGMRADIVIARAAAAHAAWQGRDRVVLDDIRIASRLALPHRRRRDPFDSPGLDQEALDGVLGDDDLPEPPDGPDDDPDDDPGGGGPGDPGGPGGLGDSDDDWNLPGELDDPSRDEDTGAAPAPSRQQPATAGAPYRTTLLSVRGVGAGAAGRRSRAVTSTGRRIGAARPETASGPIHLLETVRASAPHQVARGRREGRLRLRPEDLRVATLEGRESNLVLFCVDASGSMAARRRMEQVKTAVLSLLLDAYQRRDKVGLITYRGHDAELVLPPTGSIDIAATRLGELITGGRTPLAEGLLAAGRVVGLERVRDPRRRPLVVVVTDGRATSGKDAVARSQQAARWLAGLSVQSVVIDCENGPLRLGLARALAGHLGAEHLPVTEVSATALASAVNERVA
jgi:magnesium chelatase subunit D